MPADAPPGADPVAIVPLMHRHEVEPERRAHPHDDAPRPRRRADAGPADGDRGLLRRLVPRRLRDDARRPDRPAGRRGRAGGLHRRAGGAPPGTSWTLRRLRCGDPAADALAAAFGAREIAEGWTLNVEREDVCPVVTLPDGGDMDGYLATLGKKERHEIRRKVRRAAAVGRDPPRRLAGPARRPRDVHRPPPEALGRRRALPRHAGRRPEPRPLPPAVRAPRPDGPLRLTFLTRRRPAHRVRHPFRDRPMATSTTTPASTPTRATCRRAC